MNRIDLKVQTLSPAAVCLVVVLLACGEAGNTSPVSEGGEVTDKPSVSRGNDAGDNPSVLEYIEERYEKTLSKMMATELLHTRDGPVDSEEELTFVFWAS